MKPGALRSEEVHEAGRELEHLFCERKKMEELAVFSKEKRWVHRILTAATVCLMETLNRRQSQALHSGVCWEDST